MKRAGQNNLKIFDPNMSQQINGKEDGQESEMEKNTEVLKNVDVDDVDLESNAMESINSSSQVRSGGKTSKSISFLLVQTHHYRKDLNLFVLSTYSEGFFSAAA